MKSLVDETDHCRVCRGRGVLQSWEWNIHAQAETLQSFTCHMCQGSGYRTIELLNTKGDKR